MIFLSVFLLRCDVCWDKFASVKVERVENMTLGLLKLFQIFYWNPTFSVNKTFFKRKKHSLWSISHMYIKYTTKSFLKILPDYYNREMHHSPLRHVWRLWLRNDSRKVIWLVTLIFYTLVNFIRFCTIASAILANPQTFSNVQNVRLYPNIHV